ncbi:MAG TPA: hypothetical protein V6D05_13050, partial [Stenomitos sp.]
MTPSPSLEPTQEGLDWLGKTTLDKLPGEVQRRLEGAFQRGVEEGYRRGYEAGGLGVEQRIREEAEERIADILARQADVEAMGYRRGYDAARAEVEERLQREAAEHVRQAEARGYRSGQEEAEARLRGEVERERQAWLDVKAEQERMQADANLKEAEERMRAFERMMRDREKSLEQRLRAEIEAERSGQPSAASSPTALEEAYQRGLREASVVKAATDNSRLDA